MSARTRPAVQSRWWWLPLVFVAVTLVALFAAPLVAARRLDDVRRRATDFISPALVRVNDLEAALATETAALSESAEDGTQASAADSAASYARSTMVADELAIDSLVRHVSPDAIALAAEARTAITAWEREESRFVEEARAHRTVIHGSGATVARGRRWEAVELALTNLQRLEDELTTRTMTSRDEIRRLERMSVLVPSALVPFALLALLAIAWTARRTVLLSHTALSSQIAAEQAMAAKSALMRGVTHDLKNPLGAARGYADLLAEGAIGPIPPAMSRVVTRLRSLITMTLDTVNDLVDLSHADLGALRIDRHETDVVALAREVVNDYGASGDAAGVALHFEIETAVRDAPQILDTDPIRVTQVLGNLLSNALKYTPSGGSARVCVRRMTDVAIGAVIAIDVSDTGPGIPLELRERVFEEFFRVPDTSAAVTGTGVGLAIARRVARLLGGDIRVGETPGGGATFTLMLPERR